MDVTIRRVDKEIPLPAYQTQGAAAMDCAVREDATIEPHSIAYVPLNISIHPPKGHFVLMTARSSLHKRGLMFGNSVAIFDEDYSGDEDEYKVILYNFTDQPVEIKKGERVAQIMVLPVEKVTWNEVKSLGNLSRGGIGSTGIN
jgi:dUTP pyrophosphatase